MTTRTGGRILVDQLVAQGCERIFTVPGESFLAVLDALHDTPAIDLVTCRQEGGVAFSACADGALTGRPGVAFVTRGPGATNAAIGVHVAMQDSQPMILFIGDVDRTTRDREAFQEVDFTAMFTPLAKWAARIDDARRIPEYLARAYATAMNGRPGPVVLALPEDMLLDVVEAVDRPRVERSIQDSDIVADLRVGEMIAAARAPVAIIGGGSWSDEDGQELAEFGERYGIPLIAAFRRQSTVDNDAAAYAGNLGYGPNPKLVERVRAADLLLVLGPRLGEATTDGYALITPDHPTQQLVHVHPDPNELHSTYRTDVAICADPIQFVTSLNVGLFDGEASPAAGEAHAEYLAWSTPTPREDVTLDLGQCVLAMRDAMPADTIICNGAGNYSGWWHRYWRYGGYDTQLAPTAGAMGYGLPAAIAASLRHPDRSVVALAGDGCFLMNGQELATAVQHGCSILVIVVDNGAYGTIRMHQEREFPGRVAGTVLGNPDFAALARAYGCWAATVETTAGFAPALAEALAQSGVKLLHLKTDVEAITPATTLSAIRERARLTKSPFALSEVEGHDPCASTSLSTDGGCARTERVGGREQVRHVGVMKLLLPLLLLATPANAQLSAPERRMQATVTAEAARHEALLEKLVRQNSGTLNLAGVKAVGDMVRGELEPLGFTVKWIDMAATGRAGHLVATHKGNGRGKRVLMIAHLDTVFEPTSPFQGWTRDGTRAVGPGSGDDKGGIVVVIAALRAMQAAGTLKTADIEIVMTGDEERSGKPLTAARADLIAAGKRADVALEYENLATEGGREFGSTARRSSTDWTLTTSGKTGHSSAVFGSALGYGAIYELARIVDTFRRELPEANLTYNVGVMAGGTPGAFDADQLVATGTGKPNIIAAGAVARGDLRSLTPEQNERVIAKMKAIVAQHLPGTDASIVFSDGYPPMAPTPGNRAILDKLNAVNRDLALPEMAEFDPAKRGAADSSFVAADVDTLAGMGPVSGNAHAEGEWVDLASLPRQALRSAVLISRYAAEKR